jgi:integrase/recombinase XerD
LGKKRIRPPKQRRLPSALPDPEIRALLGCVRNPGHKTCLSVMYACGLRISEAAHLEVGAIDSANRRCGWFAIGLIDDACDE